MKSFFIDPKNMNISELLRQKIWYIIGGVVLLIGLAYAVAHSQPIFAISFLMLPFVWYYLIKTYKNPVTLLFSIFIYCFLVSFIGTYLKVNSAGLGIDFLLILSYVVLLLKGFSEKIPWSKARTLLVAIVSLWMFYVILELLNPEAPSKTAWFYAMRGIALYMWMFIPLGLILLNKTEHVKWFLYIWGVFAILATLYGCKQLYWGLNSTEQAMMDAGMAGTHILWGKLRVFSLYSDAGQFGGAQAHAGITAFLLAISMKTRKDQLFFWTVCLFGFYGMLISGTRGALFVPFGAIGLYLFIKKNIRIMIVMGILAGGAFYFLKYTYIAHNIYSVRRMRTAFDPNDPSFQVRMENQRIFRAYLKSRPFGGGVGVTGVFGERFSPNAFLSNVATDSGYVQIWAECGIVGLLFYLFMWMWIVFKSISIIWYKLKDPWIKNVMTALICGIAGMLVNTYSNPVITQIPSSFVIYFSIVFIFISPELEKQLKNV